MKVVSLVPIKLNSQRLPNKNILPIQGKPLCWHILHTLLQVNGIDEVYAYCSDSKIKQYIPEEAHFLQRDKSLDQDLVKGFDIYRSFINKVDADIYILAHTTSPFVKASSIENALAHVVSGNHDSAFSAQKIKTFAWYQGSPINYDITDVPRTQDLDPIYVETSGFFIFYKDVFIKRSRRIGFTPYIQEVDPIEAIDIDEPSDYDFAVRVAGK